MQTDKASRSQQLGRACKRGDRIGQVHQHEPPDDSAESALQAIKVAAHFRCSGTHLGECRGHPPSGRRFGDVDEIYIFRVSNGKLAAATGVEDNLARMRQLGLWQ